MKKKGTDKKNKGKGSNILLILILVAGLALLLYPSFANYWNSLHASRTIATYTESVANLNNEDFERMWQEAVEYNRNLSRRESSYDLSAEQREEYERILNVGGSGVMGYIDIDSLNVSLPVYHGTSEGVLQVAIGHLDWTSLPVGGPSSHCVISGHRGLPRAKLFTDLDELKEGDTFRLNVLDEVLTYEVDQIRIVKPSETEELEISEGMDYCTLFTCTPYGINTHRLLVRGHRIENDNSGVRVVSEATVIDPLIIAPIFAVPLLVLVMIGLYTRKPKKRT